MASVSTLDADPIISPSLPRLNPMIRISGGARKGAKQFQEDAFCFWRHPSDQIFVGAVFDGHGGFNGAVAATTGKLVTEAFLNNNVADLIHWPVEVWSLKLVSLFEAIHSTIRVKFMADRSGEDGKANGGRVLDEHGIIRVSSGDPVHGGTTGSVLVWLRYPGTNPVVICANVGDSTCILFPEREKYEFLSVDHGPESEEEYLRVQQLPAEQYPEKLLYVYDKTNVVKKYECPLVFLEDGRKDPVLAENPWGNGLHPTNVRYEPAVYAVTSGAISRDTTCIAMTRALGDFYAHQFGLTHKPSITIRYPPTDFRYTIAVASDGVWDCWRYEDFAQFVNTKLNQLPDIDAVVEHVLHESISRAIKNFGSKHYDDASLVMLAVNL